MFSKESTVSVKASKEAVWRMWTNVQNWPLYDTSLESVEFDGEVAPGKRGVMIGKNGMRIPFEIVEFKEGEQMVVQVDKLGAKMQGSHRVESTEEGTKIVFEASLRGFMAWWYRSQFVRGIGGHARALAENMAKVAAKI